MRISSTRRNDARGASHAFFPSVTALAERRATSKGIDSGPTVDKYVFIIIIIIIIIIIMLYNTGDGKQEVKNKKRWSS